MLTVRKIGSGQAGDYSQYLTGRADDEREAWQERGDYYTGDGAAGEWRGDAATLQALGVEDHSPVEREQLARALRGQRADTGEQLRRPGANGVVNSHDLTLGAPKSLSVLWAQSNAQQRAAIEQALKEAAEATVRYMALTTPCVQRRTESGERVWEPAQSIASAQFVHHTARATHESAIPDPHLHVHCVVVAATRSGGAVVTPNQAAWMRHGREGGAYFRSELAGRLCNLGVGIEPGTGKAGRFFEVEGVPRELCDRLSGRSREVDAQRAQFIERYGRLPQERELADLAIKSRESKTAHTVAQLEPYWRAVAAEHGFDTNASAALWNRERARPEPVRAHVEEELLRRIEGQGATVRSREVRAMAYELTAGTMTPEAAMQLVADMQQRGVLVALSDDRVTTRSTRAQELYCLSIAQHAVPAQPIARRAIERGIEMGDLASGAAMSDEQVQAVEALTSDARVVGLVGRAGTGKGVVIRAASEAYQADSWQVLSCATQGARAQGLGAQAAGQVMTINQLAHRVNTGRLAADARTVIFVDEAGMVDTHRMANLLQIVETHGCSLRLVGDPAQLSAIGPGGLLPQLLALDRVPVAELVEIHRTPHQWLQDFQNHVRDGNAEAALSILHEHDAAHMLDTQTEAMQRMVDDWDMWRYDYAPGDSLLVVHTTNADVDAVNLLAQAKRKEAGELGAESVRAPDRPYDLHPGDRVMFREGAYRSDDPAERRVENGTRGTIEHVDRERGRLTVRLEEPGHASRSVEIELERCRSLRLDYASHVYPAQGDTRSRTAELTGGLGVSRESAYVGGSRLRERHDLYTSREALGIDGTDAERWQRLADQINESRTQLPSIAYTEQPDRDIATRIPQPVPERVPERDNAAAPARLADVERELAHATASYEQLRKTFPSEIKREMDKVKREYEQERRWFEQSERNVAETQRKLEQLKPWQRDQLREARTRLADQTARRDRSMQRANQLAARHQELSVRPDAPKAWRQQHAADLIERERRVADLTSTRDEVRAQAIEHHVRHPQPYLTRLLGERPARPEKLQAWERAARAVETYRHEYGVTSQETALGREPEGHHKRWAAFDNAKDRIMEARDKLGLSPGQKPFAPERIPGLSIEPRGRGRGISRDL